MNGRECGCRRYTVNRYHRATPMRGSGLVGVQPPAPGTSLSVVLLVLVAKGVLATLLR